MTPKKLLQILESLNHADRTKQMVEWGQRSQTDPNVAATLYQLSRGNFYERYLALQSCFGSRNQTFITQSLSDPSQCIRTLAFRLMALFGEDAIVLAALETIPSKLRRKLLYRLYRRGRQAIVDQCLNQTATTNTEELIDVLSFGSSHVVNQHIHLLLERGGSRDWIRLSRRHPALVAQTLRQTAETAEELNPRLIHWVNAVLPYLAELCPDDALNLCQALMRTTSIAQINVQSLVQRHSHQIAELICQSNDRAYCDFTAVIQKLEFSQLEALINHGYLYSPQYWLAKLPSPVRSQLYETYNQRWRDANGILPVPLVKVLTRSQRLQEAHYHLNLPLLQTRPAERLPYAAFLPWEEAWDCLKSFILNPDPDLRCIAWRSLVETVRFNRDRVPDLLKKIGDRCNEQDPVRGAILATLAGLQPGLWQPDHLEPLTQVVQAALNAADLSAATACSIERFVIRLLPFHPLWSAEQLAHLCKVRGRFSVYNLGQRLSNAQVRQMAPLLLPVFRAWEDRDRARHLITVAHCFSNRLKVFEGLVEILERIIQGKYESWVSSGALSVLATHHRDRLRLLVPALIHQDPSWMTQQVVQSYIHHHRQDLLTPFLQRNTYSGKFATGKTTFVLSMYDGFNRWTLNQQQQFAETLSNVTHDDWQNHRSIFCVMGQLGNLQAVQPNRLIELAHVGNTNLAIRDYALRVLARRDNGDGIPFLLEAMDDDRARIAIYALRTAILSMPPQAAVNLLKSIPLERITVAKEVMRLMGEFTLESAYQELLTWYQQPLHRDVRVALLRSLWLHLERTETWDILEQAALSEDGAIATMVSRTFCDRLSTMAQQKLLTLLIALMQHADPLVRMAVLQRLVSLPIADPDQQLQQPLTKALQSSLPDESSQATSALLSTYSGKHPQRITQVIEAVLPYRQNLQTLLQSLKTAAVWRTSQFLPTVRVVLQTLAVDPVTTGLRVKLAIALLPTDELLAFLIQVIPTAISEVQYHATQWLKQRQDYQNQQDLLELETSLSQQSESCLRRLALAAFEAQVSSQGWTDERRDRLKHYQQDGALEIAAIAQFIFPPQHDV
jgi:hypothetical protein